jgi:hypothetical protein
LVGTDVAQPKSRPYRGSVAIGAYKKISYRVVKPALGDGASVRSRCCRKPSRRNE